MQVSDLRVQRTTLDNGLRVVCVEQPLLHTICVTLQLNIGSRFEDATTSGCSHMLEHMLFRGTPSHPTAHAQACAVERLGATLYAATHADHGSMSLSLPPENLATGVALLGEIVTRPVLSDIQVERGIIREEILEGLDEDEQPIDPDNILRALMYEGHALGLPITGTLASVDAIDEAALRVHHRRFYTGANAVVCFAGPIDSSRCVDLAARSFEAMPTGDPPVTSAPQRHPGMRFRYTANQGSQTDLRLAFRAPGLDDPDEPATELLVRLLDDGMSTRVYARICDEQGLCYDASADYEPFADDGVLDFAAVVRHARAPLVMRELCSIVRELADGGPEESELQTRKDRHRWELLSLLDNPEGLADYHGLVTLQGLAESLHDRQEQIDRVTRDQVVEVARRIFRPESASAVAVGVLRRSQRDELERLVQGLSR